MNRDGPKVQDLHRRPDHIIGPQRWQVDVLEFLHDRSLPTSLGDRHECKEGAEADGGEDKLVHCHALHGGDGAAGLGDGEGAGQEAEPLELEGRHEEAVGHEAGEAFEVEWRWGVIGGGHKGAESGGLFFQVGQLDGDEGASVEIVGVCWESFPSGFDGGEGLSDGVSYATEDLSGSILSEEVRAAWSSAYSIGYHSGEDWFFGIVGVEFGYQPHGEGDFDDKDDGM